MRLIDTSTLALEEFSGHKIPQYAILSHTWEHEEVSYQEYSDGSGQAKQGYAKIRNTCQIARESGIPYAWVDTCCINKDSSAELSEAINSMFKWYEDAEVCYVYLSDLSADASLDLDLGRCRWFKRGWTLQELIAPQQVYLHDQTWQVRGSKRGLAFQLASITDIPFKVLFCAEPLHTLSVAQKMSWASKRETTRPEDIAYCLLGLFDVNMPLLYGEGTKAFQRLQEEIIRTTPDLSLFAWTRGQRRAAPKDEKDMAMSGILAVNTSEFARAGQLSKGPDTEIEFSLSNRGIKISGFVIIQPVPGSNATRTILFVGIDRVRGYMGIRLRKCGYDQFARQMLSDLVVLDDTCKVASTHGRYLLTQLPGSAPAHPAVLSPAYVWKTMRFCALQIGLPLSMQVRDVWPSAGWDRENQVFVAAGARPDTSTARIRVQNPYKLEAPSAEAHFDCLFFCFGWAKNPASDVRTAANQPLGLLVADLRQPTYELSELLRRLDQCHPGPHLEEMLRRICLPGQSNETLYDRPSQFEIPLATKVMVTSPDGTEHQVLTYRQTVVKDRNICYFPFFRIEFSWRKSS